MILHDKDMTGAASVDQIVHALVTIGVGHREVHEGEMFVVSQVLTATTDFLLTVPAGKTAHFTFEAYTDANAAANVQMFPLVTASNNGTAFSQIFNKMTAGGSAPSMVVTTAPTVTSTLDATTRNFYGLLAVAGNKCGGLDREQYEYILTAGKHLIRVTRGASGNLTLQMQWYEEPV